FQAVVDRPRCFMRDGVDEPGCRRMTITTFLDTAKGQMYLRADARQVYVAHAVLALVTKVPHLAIVFRDDRQGKSVFRVIIDSGSVLQALEGNQGDVRTKHLLANGPAPRLVVRAISERTEITSTGTLRIGITAPWQQYLSAFLFGQLVI